MLISNLATEHRDRIRRLASDAEAVFGVVWQIPEIRLGFAEIDLSPHRASLAGRAACLKNGGAMASAVFAPMNPVLIQHVVDHAWQRTSRDLVTRLRRQACEEFLSKSLKGADQVNSRIDAFLDLATSGTVSGHPFYAGLLESAPPTRTLGKLWWGCELIREHRGDSHRNAWLAVGLTPVEIIVLTELWRSQPIGSVATQQMGWQSDDVAAAVSTLAESGLLVDGGLSEAGRDCREWIEMATDVQEVTSFGGDSQSTDIFDWLHELATRVKGHYSINWEAETGSAPSGAANRD
jgi:hypothetical protein